MKNSWNQFEDGKDSLSAREISRFAIFFFL